MRSYGDQQRRRRAIREAAKTAILVLAPMFLAFLTIWMMIAIFYGIKGA